MAVTEARSHRSTRRGPGGPGHHALPAVTACLTVLAALTVVTTGPASARSARPTHHRPPSRAVFAVGAAAVDVTPPTAGPGVANPAAACATPLQLAQHDGHHLLSLEEPYTDVNHNGIWDVGEPFVDCPTPLVNGGTAPPDGRWDGIMLGGGDGGPREPTAVLDHLWARTVVVRSGGRTVSLTSVDNEGVFKEIWDQVRAKVRADGYRSVDTMLFTSTHDESAPDTIGITGPNQLTSGVDAFYVQFLVAGAARSIERAATRLTPAVIRYGSVHPDNLVPCWSSYPFVADEDIGAMQARSVRDGHVIVTLANYGIHAEELGFSSPTQDSLHLSSDWPHFARRALEARYGGVAMTVAGAVGSVEMPQVYPTPRSFEPVGVYSSTGNGGCRTTYATDASMVPYGYTLSTKARGQQVARWTATALDTGAWSRSGGIDVATKSFFVPLGNALFALGSQLGVIGGKTAYLDGVVVPRGPTGAEIGGPGNEFQTDVFWLRIGDGGFASAPGELFPYTYIRVVRGPGRRGRARPGVVTAAVDRGPHEHALALRGGPRRRHDRLHLPEHERGRRAHLVQPRPARHRPLRLRALRRRGGGGTRRRRPRGHAARVDHAGAPRRHPDRSLRLARRHAAPQPPRRGWPGVHRPRQHLRARAGRQRPRRGGGVVPGARRRSVPALDGRRRPAAAGTVEHDPRRHRRLRPPLLDRRLPRPPLTASFSTANFWGRFRRISRRNRPKKSRGVGVGWG